MLKLLIRLIALFVFVISVALMATAVRADEPPGAKLFATYCAACHGANGSGSMASAIGTAKYLSANDDATIAQVIGNGIPTKGMPSWSKSKGGALTDDQITYVIAYLRSLDGSGAFASNAVQSPQNAFLIQTRLVLAQSDGADGETTINALLQDYAGYPVRGASLVFMRPTSWGVVEIGTAKTGANGIATIALLEMPDAAREVSAAFKGDQRFEASNDKIILEPHTVVRGSSGNLNASAVMLSVKEPLLAPEGNLITPNPPLLPAAILALVVGTIWTIYSHVVYQLYGIWRQGRIAPQRDIGRMNRG